MHNHPHFEMTAEEKKIKKREYAKRYYEKNKHKWPSYPSAAKPVQRRKQLKRKYGITPEKYDDMLRSQRARCAICGTDTPGGTGCFPVDHCHNTGTVRGLLCNECNIGLGKFKDNTDTLLKAVDYLKAYHAPHSPKRPCL